MHTEICYLGNKVCDEKNCPYCFGAGKYLRSEVIIRLERNLYDAMFPLNEFICRFYYDSLMGQLDHRSFIFYDTLIRMGWNLPGYKDYVMAFVNYHAFMQFV